MFIRTMKGRGMRRGGTVQSSRKRSANMSGSQRGNKTRSRSTSIGRYASVSLYRLKGR
jgi:hypothetical protein